MLSQISSVQVELSRTNLCLSSLSGIYIPQLENALLETAFATSMRKHSGIISSM